MSDETKIDIDARYNLNNDQEPPAIPTEELQSLEEEKGGQKTKLTETQQALVKGGLIGAVAGGAVSIGANYLYGMTSDGEPVPAVEPSSPEEETFEAVIHEEAPFATTVNDDMSFSEAFAAAREELGPGGIFSWNGHTYNTYYQDEWEGMSTAEHQEYFASINPEGAPPVAGEESNEQVAANDADGTPADDQQIHQAGPDTNDPQQPTGGTGTSQNTSGADTPSPESPEVVGIDDSGDGVPDAYLIDTDGDGYAEAVAIDQNQNDIPEAVLVDTDGDNVLDAVEIDANEDGTPEAMNELEESVQVPMPDANQNIEEEPLVYEDDEPDMDDENDMSDWA